MNSELSKGLAFHCKLDEWDGTRDLISGVTGTPTDVYPVLSRQGNGRRWLDHDGINDYVTLPTIAAFGTGDFTVVMKINPQNVTGGHILLGGSTGAFDIYLYDGRIAIDAYGSSVTIGTVPILVNTNYTIIAKRSSGVLTTTINNTSDISVAFTNDLTATTYYLGKYGYAPDPLYFSGSISMCRIFNYSLTPTQITNYSKPEYPIEWVDRGATGTDLLSGWNFTNWSAQSGTTINDANTFTTTGGALEGITKNLTGFTLGKKYIITIAGTTTSSGFTIGHASGGGTEYGSGFGSFLTSAWDYLTYWIRQQGAGQTDITTFTTVQAGCILDLNAEGLARYSDGSYNTGYWTDKTNSLTATISGATVVIPPASNLGASYFNGSTGKVEFNSSAFTLGTNDATYSMRVRLLLDNSTLLGVGVNTSGHSINIVYINGILVDNGAVNASNTIGSLSLNTNYHVVITYSNGVLKSYINGIYIGTATLSCSISNGHVHIGKYLDSPSYFMTGHISNVLIHNRLLTPDEILLLSQIQ